jgi:hypothetical protein
VTTPNTLPDDVAALRALVLLIPALSPGHSEITSPGVPT